MSKLQVFLVDDHAAVREGLKLLIDSQPDMQVAGQVGDGRSALRQIRQQQPDVVVMDVSMPDLGGAETTRRLKQLYPNIRILALTRHSEQGYLRQLLEAGACGYVLKKTAADDLISAIRTVAAGRTYLDPSVTNYVLDTYVNRPKGKASADHGRLTVRETDVLRLIAWGHTNKEIATELGISVKTVEYHKANSMDKLGIRSRAEIVRYALQENWLKEDL